MWKICKGKELESLKDESKHQEGSKGRAKQQRKYLSAHASRSPVVSSPKKAVLAIAGMHSSGDAKNRLETTCIFIGPSFFFFKNKLKNYFPLPIETLL